MFKHRPVCCTVNPALGKEGEYRLVPAARKKKILVIGGGPAGMDAARVSALRGHRVELWEKGDALGGQLRVARMAPHKQALGDLIRYLSRELDRAGVKVLVGAEATLQKIRGHDPEAVVLAAGASPYLPSIEGIGRSNVVPAAEVLTGKAAVGARVVVIGGELVGCEVADFLSEAGKKVTITEMQKGGQVATKVNFFIREPLVHRLSAKGVEVFTDVQYRRITAGGIEFVDRDDQEWSIPADTIVNASGSRANQGLLSGLQGQVPELHLAGDCLEPRNILEAMADGYRIGFKI
jgi:2-enoate reductase